MSKHESRELEYHTLNDIAMHTPFTTPNGRLAGALLVTLLAATAALAGDISDVIYTIIDLTENEKDPRP